MFRSRTKYSLKVLREYSMLSPSAGCMATNVSKVIIKLIVEYADDKRFERVLNSPEHILNNLYK